jgi:hypothetical protein
MSVTFYPKRNGEYVYDVIVTEDLQARPSRRYRAHLSNAQRIEHGRLAHVQVDVTDTYGPTIKEAVGALDASFETWRKAAEDPREDSTGRGTR